MSNTCNVEAILDDSFLNKIPLIEVFVDTIVDARNISKVIPSLNNVYPVFELSHLKRVKGKEVLIFPCGNIKAEDVHEQLHEKGFDTSYLKNDVRRIEVAAFPPLLRHQYLECHAKWPCNFHADKYLEKLYTNTLFGDDELKSISVFMAMADKVGQILSFEKNCGVVIVDPKINTVIAVGYDQSKDGPCRHAIMVAVDNVAKTQNGGAWISAQDNMIVKGISEGSKELLAQLQKNYQSGNFGAAENTSNSADPDGPYLCTGYHVYTTKEPCIMCAMALVHSRCKRLFYRLPIDNGALGSLCKVHTIKDLNHHYEVFNVKNQMP